MKKVLGLLFFAVAFTFSLSAQKTVSGVITDDTGLPMIGASVMVDGTSVGTITDVDGSFSLQVPEGTSDLVVSYTGYGTQTLDITNTNVLNVTLSEGTLMDEIVVTGVASGTSRKKLSFTVEKLSAKQLQKVPATSAAGAIQGKIPGATVVNASGAPGQAPAVSLRGASAFTGSQSPLILVDGVMIEGSLADINMEDVKSLEVVKGAAASSLYGSRAANGVISIETYSGLDDPGTEITYRAEYGQSKLARKMDLAKHHAYKVDPNSSATTYTPYDGVEYDADGNIVSGSRSFEADGYADNPYTVNNDHLENFFKTGNFNTHHISAKGRSDSGTGFLVSFQRQNQDGIIFNTKGFQRNNIRLNLEHPISDKITLSARTLIANSQSEEAGTNTGTTAGNVNGIGGSGSPFYDLLFVEPDVNLNADNEEDGTPYNFDALAWSNEENPLYALEYGKRNQKRNSILSSLKLSYDVLDWLRVDGQYSYERRNNNDNFFVPKGYLANGGSWIGGRGGVFDLEGLAQTFQATALASKSFDKLNTKFRVSYLLEDNEVNWTNTSGTNFAYVDITSLANVTDAQSIDSENQIVKAENYISILDLDYDDKYIASFLFRRDGSSTFGENNRWANYYRISGAYRIGEDLNMPSINELKIRAAYGTAGLRPPYPAQYEVYQLQPGGTANAFTRGNPDLRPSQTAELEVGFDAEIKNRYTISASYINVKTSDLFWPANLSSALTGFPNQWKNVGDMDTKYFEVAVGLNWLNKDKLNWETKINFSKGSSTVGAINIPETQTGPNNAFFIREGEKFGIMYGEKFLTSLDDMAAQLGEGESISDYKLNSQGYVIRALNADGNDNEGTTTELPILLDADMNGTADQNADFNIGFVNNIEIGNFDIYALIDIKQGGDIYWQTGQWIFREDRSADFDQSAVPDGQKKARDYYAAFYNVNKTNNYFVRDGSYVKLRELSLYYNIGSDVFGEKLNFLKKVQLGVVGRNLVTISDYPGYDPEVGATAGGINWGFDGFGYPNFRTFTGSIKVTF